jgi:hypothetical protein
MLEEDKVRKLMKRLKAKSESEAIRIVIDDRLLAEEVMDNFQQLRRRGTVQDAYKRATRE